MQIGVTINDEERISILTNFNSEPNSYKLTESAELSALVALFDAERNAYLRELSELRSRYGSIFEKILNRMYEINKS